MAQKRLTEKEFVKIVNKGINDFRGDATRLESAIGMLALGRQVGWKPLYVIHTKRTIRDYEEILQVTFKDILPEEGRLSRKVSSYVLAKAAGNFWKVVSGEIKGIRGALFGVNRKKS